MTFGNTKEGAFALRVPVTIAATGTLPRSEMKATRWTKSSDAIAPLGAGF
jgi:hypothetical protein